MKIRVLGWRAAGSLAVSAAVVAGVVTVIGSSAGASTPTGVVHTKGAALSIRASASTSATKKGSVPNGHRITISCQTTGSSVSGTYGTSKIWDKTSYDGHTGYVSDAYVYTGSDGRVAPNCGGGTTPPPPPPSSSNAKKIAAVIAAAKSQTGRGYSYSWGGGGKNGPGNGICCSPSGYDDRHRYGYDCSGLTQYAFWQGARIDIGTVTGIQQHKGRSVSWSDRKPGDLIFWYSSSGSTTHVAIYLGDNKMIEAAPPRGRNSVHITTVYGHHSTVRRIIG